MIMLRKSEILLINSNDNKNLIFEVLVGYYSLLRTGGIL